MKSHKMLSMAYASLVLMLAVVFFQNAPEMKTVSWTQDESVRGLSSKEKTEEQLLEEKVTGLVEEVAKIKKDFEEAKKDKKPKKMKIKELRAFIADLEKKFPEDQISELFKTWEGELKGQEKVDQSKLPTKEEMEAVNVSDYVKKLKDMLLDKATDVAESLEDEAKEKDTRTLEEKFADLEKENKRLKENLNAEECDSYETLTSLRDMLNEKLEDKFGVIEEVEAQNSPMDYMQFAMMQMFSQSMAFNPAASMFGLNYSPFSYELQTIQTMQRFGFRAPSIFDHADSVFRLPGIDSFANVTNGRQFARDLAGNSRFGFGSQAPIIINNNNSVPSYQREREPQLFPEWNKGDGNVQIFAKGKPQSLKA